jgi:hypothetical protein
MSAITNEENGISTRYSNNGVHSGQFPRTSQPITEEKNVMVPKLLLLKPDEEEF